MAIFAQSIFVLLSVQQTYGTSPTNVWIFPPQLSKGTFQNKRKMELNLGLDFSFNTSTPSPKNYHKRKSQIDLQIRSPELKRRRFSTKNCPECLICSNDIFEVRNVKVFCQKVLIFDFTDMSSTPQYSRYAQDQRCQWPIN